MTSPGPERDPARTDPTWTIRRDAAVNEVLDLELAGNHRAAARRASAAARVDPTFETDLARMRRALQALESHTTPAPDFTQRVLAEVDARRPFILPRRRWRPSGTGVALALGLAAAIAAAVLLPLPTGPRPASRPPASAAPILDDAPAIADVRPTPSTFLLELGDTSAYGLRALRAPGVLDPWLIGAGVVDPYAPALTGARLWFTPPDPGRHPSGLLTRSNAVDVHADPLEALRRAAASSCGLLGLGPCHASTGLAACPRCSGTHARFSTWAPAPAPDPGATRRPGP